MNKNETALRDGDTITTTRGLCNHCGKLCDARIVCEAGRIVLVKQCDEHGESKGLISSDAQWYHRSLAHMKKEFGRVDGIGAVPANCPDACGICKDHKQQNCLPIIEITGRCNMKCPVCMVDTAKIPECSVADIRLMIDHLLQEHTELNMITLSGGEPTLHPDLLKIIDTLRIPEIGLITVSTNGIKLAEDDELLTGLIERQVIIGLQFDGLTPATYARLRGDGTLARKKLKVLEKIITMGGKVSLNFTLAKNINERELPAIFDLFCIHEAVCMLNIMPLTHTGKARFHNQSDNPLDALTIPDVVKKLANASENSLQESDFSPFSRIHPSCLAFSGLLKVNNGDLVSLASVLDAKTYSGLIHNRDLFETDFKILEELRDTLYNLWSKERTNLKNERVLRAIKQVITDLNLLGNQPSKQQILEVGLRHIKSIFIHHYMDRANFDLARAVRCGKHYLPPDHKLIPMCVRNNLAQ